MEIKTYKEDKALLIGDAVFTEKELERLLIPSDYGNDDALRAMYVKEEKEYRFMIRVSGAGKRYFEENECEAELEINDYGDHMYVWIYVPFKIYFNIIRNGTVEYLLDVLEHSNWRLIS